MLNAFHRKIIVTAAQAAGVPECNIKAMLAVAEGGRTVREDALALMSQAQKARQLGVSRFTIRKMVATGILKPIELLPGLVRYRASDLV